MYHNVLIISDNINQCEELRNIIASKNFKCTTFNFATSPFSPVELFKEHLNCETSVLDLRLKEHVDRIVSENDLIISIHCKQIFPKHLVDGVKCINVHPGYNPATRGWYPQVFAILNDLEVGATIHEIDHKLDHGPIISRATVHKEITDTSLSLYNKILQKEIELFDQAIESIILNNYTTFPAETEGNIFLKKDFTKLLSLDLEEKTSLRNLINKLRALSHGTYKNAYFIDSETKKKVYISVNLESD